MHSFLPRTKIVFPVLALMVEFCVGILTVEALELVQVFFSGKELHETS